MAIQSVGWGSRTTGVKGATSVPDPAVNSRAMESAAVKDLVGENRASITASLGFCWHAQQ
jgi:hypothetical protein